jgi:hypothetical protein
VIYSDRRHNTREWRRRWREGEGKLRDAWRSYSFHPLCPALLVGTPVSCTLRTLLSTASLNIYFSLRLPLFHVQAFHVHPPPSFWFAHLLRRGLSDLSSTSLRRFWGTVSLLAVNSLSLHCLLSRIHAVSRMPRLFFPSTSHPRSTAQILTAEPCTISQRDIRTAFCPSGLSALAPFQCYTSGHPLFPANPFPSPTPLALYHLTSHTVPAYLPLHIRPFHSQHGIQPKYAPTTPLALFLFRAYACHPRSSIPLCFSPRPARN